MNNNNKHFFHFTKTRVGLAIAFVAVGLILYYLVLINAIDSDVYLVSILLTFAVVTVILILIIRSENRRKQILDKHFFYFTKARAGLAIAYVVVLVSLLYFLSSRVIDPNICLGAFLLSFGVVTVILILIIRSENRRKQILAPNSLPK